MVLINQKCCKYTLALLYFLFFQERDLIRLENQVQRLETENLKKDVKILQLEKQLQATQVMSSMLFSFLH